MVTVFFSYSHDDQELRNRLEAALGIRVPATLVWTYPTVAALSEHLAKGDDRVVESAAPAQTTSPAELAFAAEASEVSHLQRIESDLLVVRSCSLRVICL